MNARTGPHSTQAPRVPQKPQTLDRRVFYALALDGGELDIHQLCQRFPRETTHDILDALERLVGVHHAYRREVHLPNHKGPYPWQDVWWTDPHPSEPPDTAKEDDGDA